MRIKYVNQPKPRADGKPPKFGNIAMETGEKFFVNVGLLNLYQPGMEINPPSTTETWGTSVVQVIPAHWSPTMNGGAQAPTQNPGPTYAPPASQPQHPPPTAPQPGSNSASMPMEMSIFITGIVGRAMGGGNYGVTDIKALTLGALEAWRELQAKL